MRNAWTIAAATYGETTRRPVYSITLVAFALLVYCSHFVTAFAFYQEVEWMSLGITAGCVVLFLGGAIVAYDPSRGLMARKQDTGGNG